MAFSKYDGKNWVQPNFQKYNGSKWVNADAYRFDGSKWVLISKAPTATKTLEATWHGVYNGSDKLRSDDNLLKTTMRFGFENTKFGLNKSLFGFGGLESYRGKKIVKARLFIRSFYWELVAGGTISLGWHTHKSAPSTFTHSKYSLQRQKFTARAESRWIELSDDFLKAINNGTFTGFSIYMNNTGKEYYGNFYGVGSNYVPKLEITYEN